MSHRLALIVLATLLVSVIPSTLPSLVQTTRLASSFFGKPWNQRRRAIFGDYYSELRKVRAVVPEKAGVALIPRRPEDGDAAMFMVYHLYPRASRVFWSWPAYEKNEHEGLDRSVPPAPWIIEIDQSKRPVLKVFRRTANTYAEVPLP